MKLRKMAYTQDGQKHMSNKWYAVWFDHSEILRRLPLLPDRKASLEMANKIDKLHQLRAAGACLSPDLIRYLEVMPRRILEKLVEWGVLELNRLTAGKPIVEHIEDWKRSITAKGGTKKYAIMAASRVQRVINGCEYKSLNDISVSGVQCFLAELRQHQLRKNGKSRRGISVATSNYYQIALKCFLQWMFREGRAVANPLAHLQNMNVSTDRRHARRAFTTEELRCLIDNTSESSVCLGMTGKSRAILYRLAAETGLRAAELRSLKRTSFDLVGPVPQVTVEAAFAKNRRRDSIPIRHGTTEVLNVHLAKLSSTDQAFRMPKECELINMLRRDLVAARTKWIASAGTPQEKAARKESEFLVYRNAQGFVIDFHALRHTFISNLVAGGVHPKIAQILARHSTITLTMDRYSHADRGQVESALHLLPELGKLNAIATNPEVLVGHIAQASLSPALSPNGDSSRCVVDFHGAWDTQLRGAFSMQKVLENCHFSPQNTLDEMLGTQVYETASNSAE